MILQDIKTWRFWRYFLTSSFACLGVLSTIFQTLNVLNPEIKEYQGMLPLAGVAVFSLIIGAVFSWPRPIAQEYEAPNTKISIVKGDILKETNHLVIGTNDTFDTEPPVIIANGSLQGQALRILYGNDLIELDARLSAALTGVPVVETIIKTGKQDKYGIGAVATVKHGPRLIFFLAYAEMDAQNRASSTPDKVWKSLLALWNEVASKGNGEVLSMPVIGGGQARLSSVLPAQDAIRLTILSFMLASRNSRICQELRIVVQPDVYDKLDRLELKSFLASLRPS